jgi:hypothetical protein
MALNSKSITRHTHSNQIVIVLYVIKNYFVLGTE